MNRTESWSSASVESLGYALAFLEEVRGAAREVSSVWQEGSFRLFELDTRAEMTLDELSARVSEGGETAVPLVLQRLSELARAFAELHESARPASALSARRTTQRPAHTHPSGAQLLRHRRKTHVLRRKAWCRGVRK